MGKTCVMAALLTSTSMPPHSRTTPSTALFACAASATDPLKTSGEEPASAIFAFASSALASSRRYVNATRAPCRAKETPIASPSPREPPVTRQRFPSRSLCISGPDP